MTRTAAELGAVAADKCRFCGSPTSRAYLDRRDRLRCDGCGYGLDYLPPFRPDPEMMVLRLYVSPERVAAIAKKARIDTDSGKEGSTPLVWSNLRQAWVKPAKTDSGEEKS